MLIIFLLFTVIGYAQSPLQRKIAAIATEVDGKVAVACAPLNCDFNPHAHPPMQSVFKAPLALAAFHLIEQGQFGIDQPVRFRATDRILPHTYSPLQEQYPRAEVDIPLRELLRMAVSLSDNAAADVVLRTLGGPAMVSDYMHSLGIAGFHLEDNEAAMHRDVALQYRNWFEPAAAVQFLRRLADKSPINPEHTRMLLGWMRDTPRAANRIKGQLPQGTVVIHKPGSSDAATNDIALIELPDGRMLAIAVFITDAKAHEPEREKVIARIARAAYDAAILEPLTAHTVR